MSVFFFFFESCLRFAVSALQQNTCQSNRVGGNLKSFSFNLLLWKFKVFCLFFFPLLQFISAAAAASEDYSGRQLPHHCGI